MCVYINSVDCEWKDVELILAVKTDQGEPRKMSFTLVTCKDNRNVETSP